MRSVVFSCFEVYEFEEFNGYNAYYSPDRFACRFWIVSFGISSVSK